MKRMKRETLYGPTFHEVLGKTATGARANEGEFVLIFSDGSKFVLDHQQDCCESVYLEDVAGDIEDLVGSPLLMAEEASNIPDPPLPEGFGSVGSHTWTFYRFATIKGSVTLRWFGESNGYYSESVDVTLSAPENKEMDDDCDPIPYEEDLQARVSRVANDLTITEEQVYVLLLTILGIAEFPHMEGNTDERFAEALTVDEAFGIDNTEALNEMNRLLFALNEAGVLHVHIEDDFLVELTRTTLLALRKMFPTQEELAEGAAA